MIVGMRLWILPSITLKSVWQIPQALTLIDTSSAPTAGISNSSMLKGA
jgi:hypothetical protein